MANLLTITKEADEYFTFVLNGDTAKAVKNTRNDLLMVGNIGHFKTANGANIIKEQNVEYSNVTIIDGVTSLVPTSPDDLFTKLHSVGYFDWITATGGSGVNRFDELVDTFDYFGNDGKSIRVNESELKLEPFDMPDVSKLDDFPTPLEANKFLRVKTDASGYEFVVLPSFDGVQSIDFTRLLAPQTDFIIPDGKIALYAMINGTMYYPLTDNNASEFNTFTQAGNTVTFTNTIETGEYPVIYYN